MFTEQNQKKLVQSIGLIAIAGGILMLSQTFSTLKEMRYIGRGQVTPPSITVSGEGKATAIPDVALITTSIHKEGKTSAEAKAQVDKIAGAVIAAAQASGVSKDDVKTIGYNLNPKYEWQQMSCPREGFVPCPPGKNVQVGFEVTQSLEVKVRDINNASKVIDALTAAGATDLSGPNFTVDSPTKVQAEAREKAIADAKAKAEKLADELGVHLIRIASFSEGGNVYSAPRAVYMKAEMDMAAGSASQLPVGQNDYSSNVMITYEIN
jgi:uncharacterized protein YggE